MQAGCLWALFYVAFVVFVNIILQFVFCIYLFLHFFSDGPRGTSGFGGYRASKHLPAHEAFV